MIPACASSSLAFRMMYSAYKLNKQGDNIQPWWTPFLIWNQSTVQCPLLTVASWRAHRFLRRQIRWSDSPISLRIFHHFLWSTQDPHILLGICWVSWMCRFTCCIKFGEFWTIISSNILCVPFSLFSLYIHWYDRWCPKGLLGSVRFYSFFFLSVPKTGYFQWIYFQVYHFFLLPAQVCFWSLLVSFHFHYSNFQLQNFCLALFSIFVSVLIFHILSYCSPAFLYLVVHGFR